MLQTAASSSSAGSTPGPAHFGARSGVSGEAMDLLVKLAQDGADAMEVDEDQDLAAEGGGEVADPGADMFADASGAARVEDEAEKATEPLSTTTDTSLGAGGELTVGEGFVSLCK